MWTATIDLTKAFDSITHKSIWNALKSCGIEHDYISLLKKLYRDQKASVLTDEESDMFEIKKGTKQGDPLSKALEDDIPRASFEEQLQKMLCEFQRSTKKVGLRIRPGKTKILSNQSSGTRREIEGR